MAKKQITNKQKSRILKKQTSFTQKNNSQDYKNGIVITRYGKQALIKTPDEQEILCAIRPDVESITAGDRVVWQQINDTQGVVLTIEPRDSVLYRYSSLGQKKAVAANVTQLLIVIAKVPEVSWVLLDSYIVAGTLLNLKTKIILNKTDLGCDDLRSVLDTVYVPLGYDYMEVNYLNEKSYLNLHKFLDNEVSVFVGQSGVGKSSIIKGLIKQENIRIQDVSAVSNLGQHTTSYSTLYALTQNAAIIDSPGVRQFSLGHLTQRDMVAGFKEFAKYITQCKFRDCDHIDSPDCGIRNALLQGKISQFRYENFKKLVKG